MTLNELGLPNALVSRLAGAGVDDLASLCSLNARELGDVRGVGPKAVAQVEAALAALGLHLSADPWAAYTCARHGKEARDCSLVSLFLDDLCRDAFSAELDQPAFECGSVYDGYCSHCNARGPVSLRQWQLCGNCERKVKSLGRGIAAHSHFHAEWRRLVAPTLPGVVIGEVDVTTIQRVDGSAHDNSTEDFLAVRLGTHRAATRPLVAFELKGGRGHVLTPGVGQKVDQFQLDTTDCDGIYKIAVKRRVPTLLVNVQVLDRAHPPTHRYGGCEVTWARMWDMRDAWLDTRARPRERKDAAYFDTSMFKPLQDLPDYLAGAEFRADCSRLRREGPPKLYQAAGAGRAGDAAWTA